MAAVEEIMIEETAPAPSVATNLRALRQARDMSQQELSERSGIPQARISLIENGRSSPRVATVIALADALQLAPARLFAGITSPRRKAK